MLLTSDSYFVDYTVGSKAHKLQQLKAAGYTVPAFVVLSAEYLENIHTHNVTGDVLSSIPAALYAVRSAALVEDGDASAQAGQFMTRLAVTPQGLTEAIRDVVADARTKISNIDKTFSIIVQEFIEPECAGVLFTRNPLGGREMILEYAEGRGEQVVSGHSSTSIELFENTAQKFSNKLPFLSELYIHGKNIEDHYNFPQDIEWAYAAGQLYILQTRPITSISTETFRELQYVDKVLPKTSFYFEQTSITESLSRPTPLALSLVDFLYRAQGAIDSAYAEFGVRYVPQKQFRIIGNQLYIDKQLETKSLFPALGFLKHQSDTAQLESLAGLWTTFKNTYKFSRISTASKTIDHQRMMKVLKAGSGNNMSLEDSLQNFSTEYKTIFKINLCAQLALARFEVMTSSPRESQKLIALARPSSSISLKKEDISGELIGNSISIDDESTFSAKNFVEKGMTKLNDLTFKEKALMPKAIEVQNWIQLRELGRWLTVKLVSDMRRSVNAVADEHKISSALLHFATIEELSASLPSLDVLKERQKNYIHFHTYTFPPRLASFAPSSAAKSATVLSPGNATGVLCRLEDVDSANGKIVLLVDSLTPNLTKYFSKIEAIVCKNGGLLSHLAIMAREAKLPVVLDVNAEVFLHQEVVIDDTAETPVMVAKVN